MAWSSYRYRSGSYRTARRLYSRANGLFANVTPAATSSLPKELYQPSAPSTVLTVNDLGKVFGPDEIFRHVSFQVADREHVALVGVNGAGKSTLLRIIAGIDLATEGEIAIARSARVAVLAQEPRFESDRTVRQEAQLAFDEALSALARMRELEDAMQSASGEVLDQLFQEYERLSLHFEVAGASPSSTARRKCSWGSGSNEQMDEPVRTLSGGQKTRIALAKALLADPDLLLLDEPTNHLDLGMLDWLEGFLGSGEAHFWSFPRPVFPGSRNQPNARPVVWPVGGLSRSVRALSGSARRTPGAAAPGV